MKNHIAIAEGILPGRTFEERGNVVQTQVSADELSSVVEILMNQQIPLITMFAADERADRGGFCIYYVFGIPGAPVFLTLSLALPEDVGSFPSLARAYPVFSNYEREIKGMFGIIPEGHPDPRSLALHEENWPTNTYPLRKDFAWDTNVPETKSGDYQFNIVKGEGIYEIPVGPIHAGIIEPGNFRFSMAGEEMIALEPRLGWVHKGTEKLFENIAPEKRLALSEHVSGDSSFAHSLAFCMAMEALSGTAVTRRAQYLRSIFNELERLGMHFFDIGNIPGNGTGFTFMAAQGFRLLESLRQRFETLTGNRFLRGVNVVGGVTKDVSPEAAKELRTFLDTIEKDFKEIVHVANRSATLLNRLRTAGTLPRQNALDWGALGVPARACNIAKDARLEYPYAAYDEHAPEIALETAGDVEARWRVRIKEVHVSLALIRDMLSAIPEGALKSEAKPLPKNGFAVGVVEGWRGEIAYAALTDSTGALTRVKIRDTSFINWHLFPHLVSNDIVPDFPLLNKSFNCSYTGNDL